MNNVYILIALVLGTAITRFAPFLFFPKDKEVPAYIHYLSEQLPYASMGLLVVYCLKGVSITTYPYGIPELIAVCSTALIQVVKKNVLLSISIGTIIYMILIQGIF